MLKPLLRARFFGALLVAFLLCPLQAARCGIPPLLPVEKAIDPPYKVSGPANSMANRLYRYIDQSNKTGDTGRPDFSVAAGPIFASEEGAGLALIGAGFFKTDSTCVLTPRSWVSGSLSASMSGSWEAKVRGYVVFPQDKIRLMLLVQRFSDADRYWGIGYGAGRLEDNYLEWRLTEYRGAVSAAFRILPHTYAGFGTQISYVGTRKLENPHGLEVPQRNPFAWGIGPCAEFDTRSDPIWPERGVYLRADYKRFPDFLENTLPFHRLELTANTFFTFFKRSVLALDAHALLSKGTPPWSEMAAMGNHSRMRGYYRGQYRDKNLAEVQAEWRQPIYRRHGMVVWVGAGNVFSSPKSVHMKQTLPNAGLGYRFEFKKRLHIRLDAGIGRNSTGAYLNVGEAF